MSPYMHPYHNRLYDRLPSSAISPYDNRKRHLPPSPPDAASATQALHDSVRASVLRDGSKTTRTDEIGLGYQQEERYQEPDASVGSATTTFDRPDDGADGNLEPHNASPEG